MISELVSLLHTAVLYCFSIWCMTLTSVQWWEPYCEHNIKITYYQHRFALNAWDTATAPITGTSQARRAALWSFRRWETIQIIMNMKLILLLASYKMIIKVCKSGQRFVVLGRNNLPIEPQELESGKGLYRIPIIGMNTDVNNIYRCLCLCLCLLICEAVVKYLSYLRCWGAAHCGSLLMGHKQRRSWFCHVHSAGENTEWKDNHLDLFLRHQQGFQKTFNPSASPDRC